MIHPATLGGACPAIARRAAASSVAPVHSCTNAPASLHRLALATQASTSATGRIIRW